MTLTRSLILLSFCLILLMASCRKDDPPGNIDNPQITLIFHNVVGTSGLQLDTLIYFNAAGNRYKVTDLQYFISDIELLGTNGRVPVISSGGIHYVDARIPETCTWQPPDTIPAGHYDSISFIFGINAEKNISNRFPNPPERDMAWPDILGGGYHYMKLNMMWRNDTMPNPMPFMFHLGIGQVYEGSTPDPDSIVSFVQNWFRVTLPVSFTMETGQKKEIILEMDLDKWFGAAEIFDFAQYPMMIMQNQAAMAKACKNGRHAFRIV